MKFPSRRHFHVTLWWASLIVAMLLSSTIAFRFPVAGRNVQNIQGKMVREPKTGPPLDERAAELEVIGGDPFFLGVDDEDETIENEAANTSQDDNEIDQIPVLSAEFMMAAAFLSSNSPADRFVTDGLGPSPKSQPPKTEDKTDDWEWDGTVDENAHLDLE